ncbi:MAG TPA: SGNH/GDSL hydrolase family protein [Terriglobia bacterium]|nr:SGNH/GDSL hydrolase family protein [Terriglobia bacterium]
MTPLVVMLTVLAFAPTAPCQLTEDFKPPQATCCLQMFAQRLADQMQDWNQLGRYHADDARLMAAPAAPRVVFLGDSITDGWSLAQYFPGKPYVNRGISGQTTPQMLGRMFPDVIDLKPEALIILAGTNDIARNTGPETATMIEENFQAMADLAQAHGIRVIFCLLTPVSDYTANKQTEHRPPADILNLNAWLREYAAAHQIGVADYYAALVDDKGMLRDGYSDDGLHPNAKGYALMAPVAEAAIEKALQ